MKANFTEAPSHTSDQKKGVYYETNFQHRRIMEKKTQKDIAAFLGITPQQYNLYEQGKREMPLHLLAALAVYYHVPIDDLVTIPERTAIKPNGGESKTNVTIREADRELTPFEKNVFQNLANIPCPICRAKMFSFMAGAEGLYEVTCPECKKKYHIILEVKKGNV